MYFPTSFPKSEYTEDQAVERAKLYLEGNVKVLNSVGICLTDHKTIVTHEGDNIVVAFDQGEQYDMTSEARKLFSAFLEQVGKDYNNKEDE